MNKPFLFFTAAAISVLLFAIGFPSVMHAGKPEVFGLVWVICISILPIICAILIARRKNK